MYGLGVNRLGATRSLLGDAIANLFSNGEQGVWYDPSAASGSLDWRKNLLEYTESFDNSAWIKSGATVTANDTTAPDGTTTADKIVFDGSSREIYQAFSSISGATASIYAKGTAGQTIKFGVVGNEELFTLTGGWDRLTKSTAGSTARVTLNTYSGATARTIYIWGAQLEEASTASSYQPILSTFENAFKTAFPSHTLYQDYQGVTPVTAVGQPVGLMLDKSEGLKQGPELVTNGDFATDSDWTKSAGWSISNGTAVSSGSTGTALSQGNVFTLNKTYRITADVTVTAGELRIWDAASGQPSLAVYSGAVNVVFTPTSNTTLYLLGVSNFVGTIDNVSVTEIQGSHATQPTSTKRPIYARHPEGGIRNLLNYTEQFDNGAWIKTNMSVVANQTTAPDGTQTADKFTPFSGGIHLFGLNQSIGAGNNTASVYMKKGTGRYGGIRLVNDAFGNERYSVLIDLETGSFVSDYSKGNPPVKAYKIDDSGNGWYRLSVMLQHSTSTMNVSVFTNNDNTPAWATTALPEYTANGTDYIYAWGAQLEEATEASNYQKRVTDIDVTESGVGEVYYLKFDGVSDGMQINNLTSPNTPLTAWFGYSATNANSGNYKFLLDIQTGRTIFAASANVAGNIGYYDGAYSGFAADSDALKVLTYDLVEDNAKIRIDGTQEYSDTTYDQQAIGGDITLFQNHFSSTAFLAGNLYSCILRAAESTDKEIASTESYVAKKTGLLAQVDGIATLSLDFGGNTYTARNSNGGIL